MKPIIDISYWQQPGEIDYDLLAGAIEGVILRAAYGIRADTAFDRHYAEFTKRGIPVGAYHYICEYVTVPDQVRVMKQAVSGKTLKLGLWCDVEIEQGADVLTGKTVIDYMTQADAQMGEFGVYAANWCWKQIMGGEYARYSSRKLWCAAYTEKVIIPPGWSDYYLWQYTSSGRLPGYNGNLDMNKRGEQVSIYPKLKHPLNGTFRISQEFGMNPSWYRTSQGHNGVDWATPVGTPVHAMQDGVVIRAADFSQPGITDGKIGYGRHVRIQHPEGISIYGHFSRLMVKEGDSVKAGQQIGLSGGATSDPNSGMSTGAHLHGEYRMDGVKNPVPGGYVYNAIDILKYIEAEPIQEGEPLYKVRVKISNLLVRDGPGTNYGKYPGYASGVYEIYEERNGYGRIAAGKWISLNPAYVEKVQPTSEDEPLKLTDKQKLDILWAEYLKEHTA